MRIRAVEALKEFKYQLRDKAKPSTNLKKQLSTTKPGTSEKKKKWMKKHCGRAKLRQVFLKDAARRQGERAELKFSICLFLPTDRLGCNLY